jgi:hypothetical protein
MHTIEPFYFWQDYYSASEDERSPFYGRTYDEFYFTNTIYNYYIHPQWDSFGSNTLYSKILYCNYEVQYAIIELIGEWNDCLYNDIMFLYENIILHLVAEGIQKFILIGENVLNFHGSENDYYGAWFDEISDYNGWIILLNTLEHVEEEMKEYRIHDYVYFINDIQWRKLHPDKLITVLNEEIQEQIREL